MPDATGENVQHYLESHVYVSTRNAAWWNSGHVHRQFLRSDILRGQARLVSNAIPSAQVATAADGEDPIRAFNRAELWSFFHLAMFT